MKDKRGNLFVGLVTGIGVIIGLLIITFITLRIIGLILSPIFYLFLNSGDSTDIAYGVEKNNFWHRLYLKDDHKTVYCIDSNNLEMINLAKTASENKLKIKVTYQEYLFKGSFCNFDEDYSSAVVKNIEVLS